METSVIYKIHNLSKDILISYIPRLDLKAVTWLLNADQEKYLKQNKSISIKCILLLPANHHPILRADLKIQLVVIGRTNNSASNEDCYDHNQPRISYSPCWW